MMHVNLRKLAKDQPCLIRVPGVCSGRTDTTVLCHVRMVGLSGIGLKVPDVMGAFGCSDCHAVVDGARPSDWSAAERRLMLLEGVMRTQMWFIEHGFLLW